VLVFYMGAKNLSKIAECLLAAGLDRDTPVAVIYSATMADESYSEGSLNEAKMGVLEAKSPSIVIVGEVISDRTPWRE
jgi:uroporphyrin-III C-methyltransferase